MKIESNVIYLELSSDYSTEKKNFEEIRKAFSYVQENESFTKVVFPEGKYLCSNELAHLQMEKVYNGNFRYGDDTNVMVLLKNVSNLEIEGNGCTLVFEGIMTPFDFYLCSNVEIKNLTIDWLRPAFTEGVAISVSDHEALIKLNEGYHLNGGESVPSYQDCDNVTGKLSGLCIFGNKEKLEKVSDDTFLLSNEFVSGIKPGNRVIMRHILDCATSFHLLECTNFSFSDVTLHTTPGMGIIGHKSTELSFERLCVKPSNGRMLSTTADATHFISCYGKISFNDCYFTFMGDDAVNVHGFYLGVKEVINSRELLLTSRIRPQDGVFDVPHAFDTVEFVKSDTLYPYGTAQIIEVKNIDEENKLVQVVLDRDLPDEFQIEDVLANTTKTAELVFSNCTVEKIRGRAVLVQTRGAIIENCRFENCTGQGVHIDTATGWWESIGTRNITIRNNSFLNCGYGSTKYCDSVGVVIETECSIAKTGVHKQINISDNYIKGENTGILVRCADGVTIENNTFEIDEAHKLIDIDFAENVQVSGENISANRIKIGNNTQNISIKN